MPRLINKRSGRLSKNITRNAGVVKDEIPVGGTKPEAKKPTRKKSRKAAEQPVSGLQETIRGKWDTGLGFLLRQGQWVENNMIWMKIKVEEGVYITCHTPPIPKDLTKVENYGLSREEQVFKRTVHPEYMKVEHMEHKRDTKTKSILWFKMDGRQEKYAKREEDRVWIHGFWLFIDGVLTWLPGTYYGELNYWNIGIPINDGFKEYRHIDLEYWMNWDDIEKTELELGDIRPKARREGSTERNMWKLFYYGRASKTKCGFLMDDGKKTGGKFTSSFIAPYNELPLWFRGHDIVPANSSQINLTWKNHLTGKLDGIGSQIFYKNTTEQAFNGEKLGFGLFDESGKFTIDLITFWYSVHKICFTLGANSSRAGLVSFPTTVEDMTNGAQFKRLVEDSKRSTYNPILKQTTSGLRLFFRSVEDGLENFFDPWGDTIKEDPTDPYIIEWRKKKGHIFWNMGTVRYIQTHLDDYSKKGRWDLYTKFLRAHPRTLEDVFTTTAGQNGFNTMKLERLITNLQSSVKSSLTRVGRLEWINKLDWSKGCYWQDDSGGNIETNELYVGEHFEKHANRCEWVNGEGRPLNKDFAVNTVDPYQRGIVIDKEDGSKGAAHGLSFFDLINEKTKWDPNSPGMIRDNYKKTPRLFFSYYDRPLDVADFWEHMAQICIYWGIPMAHESNIGDIARYFISKKMEKFLIPANDFFMPAERKREREGLYGFNVGSDALVDVMCVARFIAGKDSYLQGYYYDIDLHSEMDRCPFLETAKDMHAFKANNRKKFDRTMSLVPGLTYMETLLYSKMYSSEYPREEAMEWQETFAKAVA